MASKEKIAKHLDDYGFELGEDVIEKCFDLSVSYNVEPQAFAELYVAYSATYCDGAEPTISSLEDFERKELANYKSKAFESANPQREYDEYNKIDDGDDDLMEAYVCNTPTTKKKRAQIGNFQTPVRDANSSFTGTTDSPMSVSGKDVKGKVVVTFGNSTLFKAIDWTNSEKQSIQIERFVDLNVDQDYMYDTLSVKCAHAADRVFDIGQELCVKLMKDQPSDYDNLLNNMTHVGVPNQTTVKCVGRICSDSDSKLDQNSALLIGADEMQLRTTRISFNRLKSFAVFPGQIVFAQGLNPRGDTFFVDQIHSERALKFAEAPKLSEDLSFVVASGPFTMNNDLIYEPLTELLAYCKQHKPDVLILFGPFLDADNEMVQECSIKTPYATHFETLISNIHEAVGHDMEILIVSSSRDIHSSAVYPTHPFTTKNQYKNMTFLPDPCLLTINGVTIAMTATDIYNHILDAEVALNAGDKIKRVTNYMLHQRSFYPLNPPSDKVNLDYGLAQQFATLPIVPNILIMPSSSNCYARGIDNCLVVNPGRLVGGSSSGTFGRIKITANADTKSLNNYVGCQIIKI